MFVWFLIAENFLEVHRKGKNNRIKTKFLEATEKINVNHN